MAAQSGTLQNFAPEMRKSITGMLDQLAAGDEQSQFAQLKKNLIFNDAVSMGLDPQTAQLLANATPIEQKLQQDLINITRQEQEALAELADNTKQNKVVLEANTIELRKLNDTIAKESQDRIKAANTEFVAKQQQKEKEAKVFAAKDAVTGAEKTFSDKKSKAESAFDKEQQISKALLENDAAIAKMEEDIGYISDSGDTSQSTDIIVNRLSGANALQDKLFEDYKKAISEREKAVKERDSAKNDIKVKKDEYDKAIKDTGFNPDQAAAVSKNTTALSELKTSVDALKGAISENKGTPQTAARGGVIYRASGGSTLMKPKGTDTVPAMLTPGEFVVNAQSAGKYRNILNKINNSRGGPIYLANGGFTGRLRNRLKEDRKAAEQRAATKSAIQDRQSRVRESMGVGPFPTSDQYREGSDKLREQEIKNSNFADLPEREKLRQGILAENNIKNIIAPYVPKEAFSASPEIAAEAQAKREAMDVSAAPMTSPPVAAPKAPPVTEKPKKQPMGNLGQFDPANRAEANRMRAQAKINDDERKQKKKEARQAAENDKQTRIEQLFEQRQEALNARQDLSSEQREKEEGRLQTQEMLAQATPSQRREYSAEIIEKRQSERQTKAQEYYDENPTPGRPRKTTPLDEQRSQNKQQRNAQMSARREAFNKGRNLPAEERQKIIQQNAIRDRQQLMMEEGYSVPRQLQNYAQPQGNPFNNPSSFQTPVFNNGAQGVPQAQPAGPLMGMPQAGMGMGAGMGAITLDQSSQEVLMNTPAAFKTVINDLQTVVTRLDGMKIEHKLTIAEGQLSLNSKEASSQIKDALAGYIAEEVNKLLKPKNSGPEPFSAPT
jgi:hypothetical protein